jgi:hypothetical protein
MADLREIPLDIQDNVQDIQNDTEYTKINTADISQVEDIVQDLPETQPLKAKAKGRPKGAPNKGPSKPRAKKTQIQEAPVEEESQVYEPSSPKRNLKLPTDPSTSDVAAAMLKLLQDQSYSRQSRKQRLYNSWFQ